MTDFDPFDNPNLRSALGLIQRQRELLESLLKTATELFEELRSTRPVAQQRIAQWQVLIETTRRRLGEVNVEHQKLVDGFLDG